MRIREQKLDDIPPLQILPFQKRKRRKPRLHFMAASLQHIHRNNEDADMEKHGRIIGESKIPNRRYADDTAQSADDHTEAISILKKLKTAKEEKYLTLFPEKMHWTWKASVQFHDHRQRRKNV